MSEDDQTVAAQALAVLMSALGDRLRVLGDTAALERLGLAQSALSETFLLADDTGPTPADSSVAEPESGPPATQAKPTAP